MPLTGDHPYGTQFNGKRLLSEDAINPPAGHAHRMDLSELLERTRPPDPELGDLIEQAFLEGQIDGHKADLAYLWLWTYENTPQIAQI